MADADPNQKYEPQPYPAMRYATADQCIIVNDEAEDADAKARGYKLYEDLGVEPSDGLDVLAQEALIAIALGMMRTKLAKTLKSEIIGGIRAMRERDAEEAAAAESAPTEVMPADVIEPQPEPESVAQPDGVTGATDADQFTTMNKPALRAFIKARDGKNAPGFFGEDKLRELARKAPAE
jgi:hypothetical protein